MSGRELADALRAQSAALAALAAVAEQYGAQAAVLRISQRTCESAIGVPRRAFLASLPAYRSAGGEVEQLGKLRLVEPGAYLGWMRQQATATAAAAADSGVAALMARHGLRAVGGVS